MIPAPLETKRKPQPQTLADFATPAPVTIGPRASVAEARRLMRQHRVRHLPVVDHGTLLGVASERDLLLISAIHDVDPEEVAVTEAMARDPIVLTRDTPVRAAAEQLRRKKRDAVIVEAEGRPVAVFTSTDAVAALIALLPRV